MKIIAFVLLSTVLSGCALVPAAVVVGISETDRAVNSTSARPAADSVTVSKYQFVPDAKEMTALCKKALETKVGMFSDKDVKVSHSRNYLTGVSSCTASL